MPTSGRFLKLELALVPELAEDEAVLYCDADVLFRRPLDALFNGPLPPYMGMARENTAPFYHEYESLAYEFRQQRYTVPMPFPIWTFSSGVVLFNLARLRRHDLIGHFLAFSLQNVGRIGNLDQSLLNYFFGKRVTRLEGRWNCPPYQADCLDAGHIVHFHGPEPLGMFRSPWAEELRVNHFEAMRRRLAGLSQRGGARARPKPGAERAGLKYLFTAADQDCRRGQLKQEHRAGKEGAAMRAAIRAAPLYTAHATGGVSRTAPEEVLP